MAFACGLVLWQGVSANARPALAAAADCTDVDLEFEHAALRQAEDEYAHALSRGDVEGIVNMLTEDVVLLTRYADPLRPDRPFHAVGRDTARSLNKRLLQRAQNLTAHFSPTDVQVARSGDFAYVVSDMEFQFDFAAEGRVALIGRNLHVFRKVGGHWKIAVEASIEAAMNRI